MNKIGIIAIVLGVLLLAVATMWLFSELEPKMPEMVQAQELGEPMLTEPTVVIDGEATTAWIDIKVPYRSTSIIATYDSWSLEDGVLVVWTKDDRVIIVGGDFLVRTEK